jgi:hypothetical protein
MLQAASSTAAAANQIFHEPLGIELLYSHTMNRLWSIAVCLSLWAVSFALLEWYVLAANRQQTLTAEEASSSFVAVAFLEHRLQHHRMNTSFPSYVLFWLGRRVLGLKSLFYGRLVKAMWMSLLPVLLFLYLQRRKALPAQYAVFSALLIMLVPGVLSLGWLGTDMGMDSVWGLAALLLAGHAQPRIRVLSALLLGVAILAYGSGLIFIPPVVYEWFHRSRSKAWWLAAAALFCAPAICAVLWWTNIQTLVLGGGKTTLSLIGPNLLSMLTELAWRGDSYYFFSNGRPALGNPVIVLAGIAGLWIARRQSRELLLLAGTAVFLYAITGGVIGVRRLVPLDLALVCGVGLLAQSLAARSQRWQWAVGIAAIVAIALLIGSAAQQRQELADGRIALPHDFEFQILPGQTQQQTFALLAAMEKFPTPGYEPDRTGSVLYLQTDGRNPNFATLVRATDAHGWSIKSDAPRFQSIRRRFRSGP